MVCIFFLFPSVFLHFFLARLGAVVVVMVVEGDAIQVQWYY